MERSEELRTQIEEWEGDLADLYTMSEEAACFRFNVDSKDEAIEIITMELEDAYKALENAEREEEAEGYAGWCDPAFPTMGDFDRMRL
jgi:hypothetical protein